MASGTYSVTVTHSWEALPAQVAAFGRPPDVNARTVAWICQQRSEGSLRSSGADSGSLRNEPERIDAACAAARFGLPGNVRGPLGLAQPVLLQAPQPVTGVRPRPPPPEPMDANLVKCAEHWRNVRAACAERVAQAPTQAAKGLPRGAAPSRA